ncbi:hypothetical protein ACNS7O_06870 [Haloferacaceae archaeon DSL9]
MSTLFGAALCALIAAVGTYAFVASDAVRVRSYGAVAVAAATLVALALAGRQGLGLVCISVGAVLVWDHGRSDRRTAR